MWDATTIIYSLFKRIVKLFLIRTKSWIKYLLNFKGFKNFIDKNIRNVITLNNNTF